MIEQFQPIGGVEGDLSAWAFVPMPGVETASAGMGARLPGGGPSAGFTSPRLAVPVQQLAGNTMAAYGGDLYERLQISTALIPLGNVVGLQQRSITVWNAYTRAQILTAITATNAEGVDLAGGPSLPYQFGPLEEIAYTVTVGTDGPPKIDAAFVFDFAPYDLRLAVTGSRVTAWSFAPDWSNGIVERIEWKTDLLQSFDASEQRGALRVGPRKSYEFEAFFDGKARRYAEALAWGWGARPWALPIWPDGQDLVVDLPAGATAIAIETDARDFAAGALAVIMVDAFAFEVLEVDAVNPGSLALKRQTTRSWPGTARIYPARIARIMDQVTLPRWSGQASGARVIFDVVGPVDHPAAPGATNYRGLPVLTDRPNWSGGFDVELARKLAILDNATGGRAFDDESGLPAVRQRMRWTLTTKAEQKAHRGLLHYLAGRTGSIWVPSWADDLVIAALIPSGSTAFDVEFCAYTRQLAQAVGRRDVRIELVGGQVLYRRIVGSTEIDDDTERLAVDVPFAQDIAPADVVQVSFLTLCRGDADAVELAHWTGDVCDSATVFRSFNTEA